MKVKKLLLIGLCLLAHASFAQKQANHWYFGRRAGINFNTGTAEAITDGAITTREGCATLSDANTGDLLFYTDGVKIYNRAHLVMPNGSGLSGHYSSTQSAIIVPNPGDAQKYYVITAGIIGGAGLSWSEVNMSLDGGRGDVVSSTKNTLLLANNTEKLVAVRHQNGADFWIIAHEANNAKFYVYLITAAGISTPTTYQVGLALTNSSDETGYLKASPSAYSPDTKPGMYRLANAINGTAQKVEIFDFNHTTGSITGPAITLSNLSAAYGLEFSADSKLLYVTEQLRSSFPFSGKSTVSQFNLLAGSSLAINLSKVPLTNSTQLSYGALQMAPDGRIYVAKENGFDVGVNSLDVIMNPSVLGSGALYLPNGFDLGGKQTLIGLPNFVESIATPYNYKNLCLGEKTTFTVFNILNVSSVLWNFGEASSTGNTSTEKVAQHQYRAAGTYDVTLTITYTDNTTKTYPFQVQISSLPGQILGQDVTLCEGEKVVLKAYNGTPSSPLFKYLWQDGSTAASYEVSAPGTYWVEVTLGNCRSRDSVVVGYVSPSSLGLPENVTICSGKVLDIDLKLPGATFLWQDGTTSPKYRISTPGTYWVDVIAGNCTSRSTVNVNFVPSPSFNLGRDTSLCVGNTLLLSALNPTLSAVTYRWQDGSTGPTFLVNQAGTYWAEAKLGDCIVRDSIVVGIVSGPPQVDLGPDETISQWGGEKILRAYSPFATYRWQDGSTDSTFRADQPGTYWVEVSNGCGSAIDSLTLTAPLCGDFQIPNIITPNGDGYNDTFHSICDNDRWTLEIFDRWGRVIFTDGVYDNSWSAEGLRDDVYYYSMRNNVTLEVRRGWVKVQRK
jgi:gliding motility-associated-like protein